MNKILSFLVVAVIASISILGCVDNNFDEPDNSFEIKNEDVISIQKVLSYFDPNGGVELTDELLGGNPKYIKATIIADDASGNFYRSLTFDDGQAGLSILVDRNELNAEFPQYHIIYVKLNGLTLGSDANLPRLGYGVVDGRLQRIPDVLVNDYLFAGGPVDAIDPGVQVSLSDFISNPFPYYNRLVYFEGVEFSNADIGSTFAYPDDPGGPRFRIATIQDCQGNEVEMYNSGYSDFAGEMIPSGNGILTAIAGVHNDNLQVIIRDLYDVMMEGERCDGGGTQAENEITIQSLQDRYYNLGGDAAPEGYIKGIVISDRNTGQFNNRNLVIQNGEDGIVIRFDAPHSFDLGTELQITVTDRELSEYNNLLQVNNVPLLNAVNLGQKPLPQPKELTIAQLLADNNTYESTRVIIKGATLSGGSTWAGSITVDDGTGTIDIFTFNNASFSGDPVPSGTVDVTAIVSQYQDNAQLVINGPGDVTGGTTGGGGNTGGVNQDFEGGTDFDPISFEGWLNVATKGTRVWYHRSFGGNGFAECEAYQDTNPETEAWLVTPVINTDEKSILSFETSQAFWKHQGLSLWISPEFANFEDATWTKMDNIRIANESDDQYEWVPSGDIDLKDFMTGKVRVAFKYEGTAAQNTTKMRIDNVTLK